MEKLRANRQHKTLKIRRVKSSINFSLIVKTNNLDYGECYNIKLYYTI